MSIRGNLRAKVTLGVVLPLLLILGSFTAIEHKRHQESLLANLALLAAQSGQVIEDNLRQQMVKVDFEGVQSLIDSISARGDFSIVYLLDPQGKVTFAPQGKDVGLQLDNDQPDCQPCHRLSPADRPKSVIITEAGGQRVFRSMNPIENDPQCTRCHDPRERLIGLLLTDISMALVEASLAAQLRESLLWNAATILATVLVVNLALSRFVLRRIEKMAAAISDLGKGRPPAPLPENQSDEIGRLAGMFNVMAQQVEARNAENQALSEGLQRQSAQRGELLKRLITAQEDERGRVARELHDELGQVLGGLALRAEAIGRFIQTDTHRALEQIGQVRALIAEATDRMYDLILALRPSALDDLGLAAAIRAHAERLLAEKGIAFEMDASQLTGRLPPEVETALYRTFQEALSNVVRHAQASRVRISLASRDGAFEGEIVDDGRGFSPQNIRPNGDSPRGLGLLGMEERIAQCGGRVEIASRPGEGALIHISIPLSEVFGDPTDPRLDR